MKRLGGEGVYEPKEVEKEGSKTKKMERQSYQERREVATALVSESCILGVGREYLAKMLIVKIAALGQELH